MQKGKGYPAHIIRIGVLKHLVACTSIGYSSAAGSCSGVIVGLVFVPKLDVVEVFSGKSAVYVLVAFVVVDDDIDGVCLRPIGIVGILFVAVVEDALVLDHEGLDEGIGHGVGLRLVGSVSDQAIENPDSSRLRH